jgi:anti-anti-sigma factor
MLTISKGHCGNSHNRNGYYRKDYYSNSYCYIPPVRGNPTQGGAAVDPRELDGRTPARAEQANGHANGLELARVASGGNGVVLAVAGEIDLANAEEFGDRVRGLIDSTEDEVVISLRDCGFIDSTGIRTLIMLARELRARGQTLVLAGLNGGPRRVFEIAGLLDRREFELRDAAPGVRVE